MSSAVAKRYALAAVDAAEESNQKLDEVAEGFRAIADALKADAELAEFLRNPAFKDDRGDVLGEALKKHDIEAAKKELERLQKLLEKGKLNRWQRKKLAKALKKAAKVLKNKDEKELVMQVSY